MSDGDLLQAYDDAVGDSDDHLAGLRAVERAARVAALREAAELLDANAAHCGPLTDAILRSNADALRARAEGQSNG